MADSMSHDERTRIGIALFDGAEELDWAGPWEVLSYWSRWSPEDGVEVFTVAQDNSRPIECAKGLRVLADYSWESAPEIDVLIYPGGRGTRAHLGDEAVRAWVRSVHERARLTTSVCTGAWVLADAGLLAGRAATTHWEDFEQLLAIDGSIDAKRDARFVDEGDIITAAGVSAGIDMALYLIVRLHSEDRAREIKRRIQYEPEPPV
jgi:transcriptional regulator GlxA family with amidase domain